MDVQQGGHQGLGGGGANGIHVEHQPPPQPPQVLLTLGLQLRPLFITSLKL